MVQLRLPGYQGPLDLLLQLIEHNELDISEVSLVQVTEQYLEHLEQIRAQAGSGLADSLAEFVLIGGKLMLLKSKAMLPREFDPDALDDEDDVGRELVDMLEEYRRYRQTTSMLGAIDRSGLRSFRPGAPPPVELPAPVGLPDSVTLDLITKLVGEALQRADARAKSAPQVEIKRDPVTVRDKIEDLQNRLRRHGRVSFRSWIAEARTRVEVIVTFMAILELYKARSIEMSQDETYGDIVIEAKPGAATAEASADADADAASEVVPASDDRTLAAPSILTDS